MIYRCCNDCGDVKAFTAFYKDARGWFGLFSRCKSCHCKRTGANPNARKNKNAWKAEHPEYNKEYHRQQRETALEEVREYMRKYRIDRKRKDPDFKMRCILRTRLYQEMVRCLSGSRGKSLKYLGESIPDFLSRVAAKFKPGWDWENWGIVWELDHIRPCASFDLTQESQRAACFHFSNFQPLAKLENQKKGAKLL